MSRYLIHDSVTGQLLRIVINTDLTPDKLYDSRKAEACLPFTKEENGNIYQLQALVSQKTGLVPTDTKPTQLTPDAQADVKS